MARESEVEHELENRILRSATFIYAYGSACHFLVLIAIYNMGEQYLSSATYEWQRGDRH